MKNNRYTTLSLATKDLKERGYDLDFNLRPDSIECKDLKKTYAPDKFNIDEYHRFEGITNPGDMSIVYAVTTDDGEKGTLVDAYGPYEDPLTAEMVQRMKIDAE